MKIQIDSGNLDDLDAAIAEAKRLIEIGGDNNSIWDVTATSAIIDLIDQAEIVLMCAEDDGEYERPSKKYDGSLTDEQAKLK